jgi:hypothetical protein
MRLDSAGNVGIGATPVAANTRLTVSGGRTNLIANSDAFALGVGYSSAGAYYLGSNSANNALVFSNAGGSEVMRLRSDGLAIIGTASNTASWSGASALQIANSASFYGDGQAFNWPVGMSLNAYRNSTTWYYSSTGIESGRVEYGNGASGAADGFATYGAASGTAGGAITWTQLLNVKPGTSLSLQGATIQAGAGITFPATQVASSNANTLDDYEEGSWTPSFDTTDGNLANFGYVTREGTYTKIGRLVTISCALATINAASISGTGVVHITGLPFSVANSAGPGRNTLALTHDSRWTNNPIYGQVQSNTSAIKLFKTQAMAQGGGSNIAVSDFTATNAGNYNIVTIMFTYET